jgi:hypothetical protein
VRGHDELRAMLCQLVQLVEERQLSRHAECRLGFVQEAEPVLVKVLLDGGEKRLAVAELVEAASQELPSLAKRCPRRQVCAVQKLVGMRAQKRDS